MPNSRGSAKPLTTHTCPRCGYDQAGEVQRWEVSEPAACPLVGRCSECGLQIEWRLVMRPELNVPRWFVETAEVGRRRWAAVGTAWRSILPWIFWRKVRMEHPIVLRWALAVSLLILVSSYLLMVGASVLTLQTGVSKWDAVLEGCTNSGFWMPFSNHRSSFFYSPYGVSSWSDSWSIRSIEEVVSAADLLVLLMAMFVPLTFRLLPVTLRRCNVRKEHLVRIALYSTPWVLLWAGPLMRTTGALLVQTTWVWRFSTPGFDLFWLSGMIRERTAAVVVPLCALWLFVAWGFACSRYLKLPYAWAVASAMVIISTLASLLLVLWWYPMAYKHLFSGLV